MKEQSIEVLPEPRYRKKRFGKRGIFIFFLLIIGTLLFFAYYGGDANITGNFIGIGGGSVNEEKAFQISANLQDLNQSIGFKQVIERIVIKPNPGSEIIYIGKDVEINLGDIENAEVVIESMDGIITISKDEILNLKGRAEKVTVNNIPVQTKEDEVEVSFKDSVSYETVEIYDVYLRRYSEQNSGRIEAKGRTFFDIEEENIIIERFQGDVFSGKLNSIGIESRGIQFKGVAENLVIEGELNVNLNN